jgi:hypothetical protein
MGNGSISENDLMRKLVNAKKVMNKVDGGNYEKGNIDESILFSDPSQLMESDSPKQPNTRPVGGKVDIGRIQSSKLPDAIKQAMIDHPIEQMSSISLNETLDMDFVKGAKKLMEREGLAKKPETKSVSSQSIDMNTIAVLIENTVRKVMDEKLNQILSAQQTSTINENLVLKVGDSIFRGKITGVNKAK